MAMALLLIVYAHRKYKSFSSCYILLVNTMFVDYFVYNKEYQTSSAIKLECIVDFVHILMLCSGLHPFNQEFIIQ